MHHIIYLPGLGDHATKNIQEKALSKWQKYGLNTHYQEINWHDNEPYKDKLNKINTLINDLNKPENSIVIIGASGGATLAANVFAANKSKIYKVIFICGKLNRLNNIQDKYFIKNPAYKICVEQAKSNIPKLTQADRKKMLSVYPIFDEIVAIKDAQLSGSNKKMLFSFFHSLSIYLALSIYKRQLIKFLNT